MELSATDVLEFREVMEELGISLTLDEVTSILRMADDMSDARSIAKEIDNGTSLFKIYDNRLLSRIISLEKKISELEERLNADEQVRH